MKGLLNRFTLAGLVLCAWLLFIQSAFSQSEKDISRLQELAAESNQAFDAAVQLALQRNITLRTVLDDGTVIVFAGFFNGKPLFYTTFNTNAAKTVATDIARTNFSLDGSGITLGIWDGGNIRDTHQELTGRVVNLDAAGLSDHSTHVSGTMIASGVNGDATGMSFNAASIRGHDFGNDLTEMAAD